MNRDRGGWHELRPEPARLWLCHLPAWWPSDGEPWTDVARGRIAGLRRDRAPAPLPEPAAALADLVYLPPVPLAFAAPREALLRRLRERDLPALAQRRPGEPAPQVPALSAVDLLPALLAAAPPREVALGGADLALWPLIAGLAEPGEAAWLAALAAVRIRVVVPVVVELEPADRRALAGRWPAVDYDRLFHGEAPREEAALAALQAAGFEVRPARPALATTPLAQRNRDAATALALAADRALREAGAGRGAQELWSAARAAERCEWDLAALVRERQLPVLPWATPAAALVLERWEATRAASESGQGDPP